jgi:hypothetical protein
VGDWEETRAFARSITPSSRWAAENRIMCDLLDRGIVPERRSAAECHDDLVVVVEAP